MTGLIIALGADKSVHVFHFSLVFPFHLRLKPQRSEIPRLPDGCTADDAPLYVPTLGNLERVCLSAVLLAHELIEVHKLIGRGAIISTPSSTAHLRLKGVKERVSCSFQVSVIFTVRTCLTSLLFFSHRFLRHQSQHIHGDRGVRDHDAEPPGWSVPGQQRARRG